MPEIHGIVSFLVDGNVYIKCDRNGVISGFESKHDAFAHYERQYEQAHGTSITLSAGACIHFIQLNPSCHHVDTPEELVPDVVTIPFHINAISGEFAPFYGILCEGAKAKEWHDSGITPRLVAV